MANDAVPYQHEMTNGECAKKLREYLALTKEHDPAFWPHGITREIERAAWVLEHPTRVGFLCECEQAKLEYRPLRSGEERGFQPRVIQAPATARAQGGGAVDDALTRLAEVMPPKPRDGDDYGFQLSPLALKELHRRFDALAALSTPQPDAVRALPAKWRIVIGPYSDHSEIAAYRACAAELEAAFSAQGAAGAGDAS